MKTLHETLTARWRDVVNLALGLWLVASPWVLGYLDFQHATWNAWAVGAVLSVAALAALVEFHEWEEWVSIALGAWLIVAPWVLGYTGLSQALWNHLAVGLIAAGLACWSSWEVRHQQRA